MTEAEAISLLVACKALVERMTTLVPTKTPANSTLTEADLQIIQDFDRLQGAPIVAGPGLLGKLEQEAGLTKSDIIKLEQIRRLLYKRRHFTTTSKG
jgi:hypothetical protein